MQRDYPVMIYDGDCAFCRAWIERWQRTTCGRVSYFPYQRPGVLRRYRVPGRQAARSVQLIEPGGRRYAGAAAVFHALRRSRSPWVRALAVVGALPVARTIAELVYRWIAAHRRTASRVQHNLRRLRPRIR